MAKKMELGRASNGLFFRNLGWKRTEAGYAQQKFYLGRDESKATVANLRLEELWEQVTHCWQREKSVYASRERKGSKSQLVPVSIRSPATGKAVDQGMTVLTVGLPDDDSCGERPVWDETTLAIADAIRTGETVARVPLPSHLAASMSETFLASDWLSKLQEEFTGIKLELRDDKAQRYHETYMEQEGHRLIDVGRQMLHKRKGGETLHTALTAHAKWIESNVLSVEGKLTPWGGTQIRQTEFLRRHLPDCPLSELDAERVDQLLGVLKLRPKGEEGKPSSVSWTRNCIKQFRSFLRWLNRTSEFAWKRPVDLETDQIRIPLTPQEKGSQVRSSQVDTYQVEELQTMWEYATPFHRLLLLLGLNCGFGRAEVASLEMLNVLIRQRNPHERDVGCHSTDEDSWIRRIRHKTGVYGEWKLWPETVRAVEWWLRERAKITAAPDDTTLLVTRKGQRFDSPTKRDHTNAQIPNSWDRLTQQVRKDQPDFRKLSYNKLRKTASNLIRKEADGEVAGVFLCHGTPVKSDGLLDVYTNRPFAKVFEAIDRVGERLRPLWATVKDPFPEETVKGGPNISQGTIRRIQQLRLQGFKITHIAKELNVSTETVRRWSRRSADSAADESK